MILIFFFFISCLESEHVVVYGRSLRYHECARGREVCGVQPDIGLGVVKLGSIF